MTMTENAPSSIHRGEAELPFVDIGDGALLQVDLANGVWIVRNRFPAGYTVQTHKHTGHVYAFTQTGTASFPSTGPCARASTAWPTRP